MLKKLILITFIVSFVQCNNYDDIVRKFENKYPHYNLEGFKPAIIKDWSYEINFCYVNNDSSEYISFIYNKIKRGDLNADSIYFSGYNKSTKLQEGGLLMQVFDQNKEILYEFITKRGVGSYLADTSDVFLKGKYYYYYTYKLTKLTDRQREYFEKNRDSLIRNWTNEIPDF